MTAFLFLQCLHTFNNRNMRNVLSLHFLILGYYCCMPSSVLLDIYCTCFSTGGPKSYNNHYLSNSSGSKVQEEYVGFRFEFVDGKSLEQIRTTGSLLNTLIKTLTRAVTITQYK